MNKQMLFVLFVTLISLLHINCQENSVTILNKGWYVARFKIEGIFNGKYETRSSGDITAGQSRSFNIPDDSTNVELHALCILYPYLEIFQRQISMPSGKLCFHVWGTIFDLRWKEVKC
jgi:cytolysin (calcineurin-like family phosphatase)